MKQLFDKNDRYFKIAKLTWTVALLVYQGCIIVVSIIMMCLDQIANGIALLLTSIFMSGISFITFAAIISFYADVKFIRNKLYNIENENADLIWDSANSKKWKKANPEDKYSHLLKLNDLLKVGAITEEEYNEQKNKLFK